MTGPISKVTDEEATADSDNEGPCDKGKVKKKSSPQIRQRAHLRGFENPLIRALKLTLNTFAPPGFRKDPVRGFRKVFGSTASMEGFW